MSTVSIPESHDDAKIPGAGPGDVPLPIHQHPLALEWQYTERRESRTARLTAAVEDGTVEYK